MPDYQTVHLARQLSVVRQLFTDPDKVDGEGVRRFANTRTQSWMTELTDAIHSGEVVMPEEPFGDFLVRGVDAIKERAGLLVAQNRAHPGLLVCCVVNGLYASLSERQQNAAYNTQQAVLEAEFWEWLAVLEEALIIVRDLSRERTWGRMIDFLSMDLSAAFADVLDMLMVGPLVVASVMFEFLVEMLAGEITKALLKVRCIPLLDLWAIIVTWVYDWERGFLRRAQAFVMSKMLKLHRTIDESVSAAGKVAARADALIDYDWTKVQDLIDVLRMLRESANIFRVCRLPIAPDTEDRGPRGGPGGDRGTRPVPTGGATTGGGGGGGGMTGTGGGATTGGGLPGGGAGGTGGGGGTGGTGGGGGATGGISTDPVAGDYVYLTAGNVAHFLQNRMGMPRDEARQLALTGNCRGELAPDTLAILNSLGI